MEVLTSGTDATERRGPPLALVLITTTVVIDALATTVIGPVMPTLLSSLTGGAMAQMSTVFGAITVVFAGMQLIVGPVQGALSDRFGRRPVILISIVGLAFYFVCLALASNLVWIFVGAVIAGAAAGSVSAAFAYVADISRDDERAARFGLLTGALSAGGASGSLIGGFIGEFNPRGPFWVGAALCCLNLLLGLFALPESLRPEHRAALKWRLIHPIGVMTSVWRDYPILKLWQSGAFLMSFGFAGINSIFILYVTFRFGWTPQLIGYYATFVMLTSFAVQSGMVARTVARFGERRVLIGGMVLSIVGVVAGGFATAGWTFTATVFVVVLGNVFLPVRLAMVNRIVGPSDRGRLSGAERSVANLAGLLAPGAFAALFAMLVGAGPGALRVGIPFFVCAAFAAAGAAVTVRSLNRTAPQD